jgi:hypothetical protein
MIASAVQAAALTTSPPPSQPKWSSHRWASSTASPSVFESIFATNALHESEADDMKERPGVILAIKLDAIDPQQRVGFGVLCRI